MKRLRIGVIGAGTIAQVEHIPNLVRMKDQFEVVGVADPSKISRDFVSGKYGVTTFEEANALLAEKLDAVVVASPDMLHHEQVMAALSRGLHVFCEKPLCYSPAEIAEIAAARDKAGKVVQVGYMKRFDPNFELALQHLPGTAKTLRYISVEVNDPDAWPFIRHHDHNRGSDIPRDLIDRAVAKQKAQVAKALGGEPDPLTYKGFTSALSSALVHDVNAVHGILEKLGIGDGKIVGGQIFAGGDGAQGAVRLLDGQALWNMVHLTVPQLADYKERIALYFDDAMIEIVFPSPYLNHQPTTVTVAKSGGHVLHKTELRGGYEEAFVEEMKGFWRAIVEGEPVRNTPEHAARDMALLIGLAHHHAKVR